MLAPLHGLFEGSLLGEASWAALTRLVALFFPWNPFFFLAHERNAIALFPPLSCGKTLTSREVFTEKIPCRCLIGSDDSARLRFL